MGWQDEITRPLTTSVQGEPVIVPVPELVRVTVPSGTLATPGVKSLTMTSQTVCEPTGIGVTWLPGRQETATDVAWRFTVIVTVLLVLPAWPLLSPL